MTALAIGFHDTSGSIVIAGNGAFPARSLVATVSNVLPDTIQINDLAGRGEQAVTWANLTSLDGSFKAASMADALAYLQGEFAKSCPIGEIFGAPVVAGADLVRGQPVAVSRTSGQLLPARADTYTLAFVAGVASADTAQGFANQPAHGAITLPDWSALTGTISLNVGELYFVGPEGGLTASPRLDTQCVVRVGLATTPQTLVVEPSTPIIL